MVANELVLELPAGRFEIPTATIRADGTNEQSCSFTAYGLTHRGFCTIQSYGNPQSLWVESPISTAGMSEAELILALATPEKYGKVGAPPINQMTAWNRQQLLFPLPPVAWIGRMGASSEAGALGFFGNPWTISTHLPAVGEAWSANPSATKN